MTALPSRRYIGVLVVAVPLMWITCHCALYLWQVTPSLQAHTIEAGIAWLQQERRLPIKVGSVKADLLRGEIIAQNVILKDPFTERRTLASAAQFKLLGLYSRNPTSVVSRPVAHVVRLPDGSWNFSPLLPKRRLRPAERYWTVQIEEGTLYFHDLKPHQPVTAKLQRVNGAVNILGAVSTFRFAGDNGQPDIQAQVDGWLHRGNLRLRVEAENVPVRQLIHYVKAPSVKVDDAARTSGTVWVYTDEQHKLEYSGVVTVSAPQAEWRLPQGAIRLRNLKGSGEFRKGLAVLQARANAGSGDLAASGSVQWEPSDFVNVALHAHQVPPDVLRTWVRRYAPQVTLAAPVDAKLRLSGPLNKLQVQGKLQSARMSVQRVNVQQLHAEVLLNPQSVILRQASAQAAGGRVQVQAVAKREGKTWNIAARWQAEGISLAGLRPLLPDTVRGTLSGVGLAQGNLQQMTLIANLRGERLSGERWRFERAHARIRWTPGVLHLDGVLLEDWTGTGYLSGEIDFSKKRLNLQVRADEVLLTPWIERLAPSLRHEGDSPFAWIYARGQVLGTFSEPMFRGILEATDVHWRRWGANYLAARVEASPSELRLESGVIRHLPTEILFQGTVSQPLQPDKARLVASGLATNVDAEEIWKVIYEQEPVESTPPISAVGRVYFFAEGALKSPVIQASVSLPTAQIRNWSLTETSAELQYAAGTLRVDTASARLGDGRLVVSGVRSKDGALSLRFTGEGLPLAQAQSLLPEEAPRDLDGTVSVEGVITGTDKDPQFSGKLQANDVLWDALRLEEVKAQVNWRNGELHVADMHITSAEGELNVASLRFSETQEVLEAEGALTVHSLEQLRQKAMDSTWLRQKTPRLGEVLRELGHVAGYANSSFRLWGSSKQPSMEASLRAAELELDGHALGKLQGRFSRTPDGVWHMSHTTLEGAEHLLTLSGEYQPDGTMRLSAEAYNFDQTWFQKWLPRTIDLSGRIEVATLEASGPSRSPDVIFTLALREPRVGAFRADRVMTGKIQLSQEKLNISEIVLAQPDGQLRIWGTIPFQWEPLGVPDDQPIDLYAEALPQPLNSLLDYLPRVAATQVEGGRWSLSAQLVGTRKDPQLSGSLQLRADRLRTAYLQTGFRDVQSSLRLNNNVIRMEQFSAVSDTPQGGRILGKGELHLGTEQGDHLDVSLQVDDFWLAGRNLSGQYGEQVRTFLDGSLQIKGSPKAPNVSGVIVARKGAFILPTSFPDRVASAGPLAINPRFDLALRFGEGMWLNSSRLSAQASGDIALRGTLQEPSVHGQLGLERGYVFFPTTRFRLEPGGTITVDYPVPGDAPFRVNVNVQANTSLSTLSPLGVARRYQISVLVNGNVTAPERLRSEFRSDPPDLSTQDIARVLGVGTLEELLTGRNIEQVLQREALNLFTSAYIPQLFSPIERGLEEALQLREFRVEYSRYEPMSITLVKRLWNGFSLSYWRTVSLQEGQQDRYIVKLLYELPEWTRLSRRLQLSFSVDERQLQTWGIEGSFHF